MDQVISEKKGCAMNHLLLQKYHDKAIADYKAKGTHHILHRQGHDVTIRITGMKAYPAGAVIQHVTETNPTDTTYTDMPSAPIFGTTPGPEDINQAYLADCWEEAPKESMISVATGTLVLKSLCQPSKDASGNRLPGRATVFVSDGTIYTAVDMTMTVGAVQSQTGPNGAIWNDLMQKAAALAITGITATNPLFSNLNYNFVSRAFTMYGLKNIRGVSGISQAKAAYALNGAVALATINTAPADVVPSHAYGFIGASWRNPWGKNSGGMTEYRQFADAEIQSYGMTITVTDPMTVDPILPIPLSEAAPMPTPTPSPVTTLPAKPFAPNAYEITSSSFKASWGGGTAGADGFRIYISTDGVTFTQYLQIAEPNETVDLVQSLKPGTAYWFYVSAYNSTGETASSIVQVKTLGGIVTPTPPPVTTPQPFTGSITSFPIQVRNGMIVQ